MRLPRKKKVKDKGNEIREITIYLKINISFLCP